MPPQEFRLAKVWKFHTVPLEIANRMESILRLQGLISRYQAIPSATILWEIFIHNEASTAVIYLIFKIYLLPLIVIDFSIENGLFEDVVMRPIMS